ncbi:hypothetical protein N7481_000012 [Penicillium waksmanii]|uniref:uncharacterized protein n=1 Tax=Penicillium waksmanii TaxID=69791 RepID=UPI002546DC15|nr:uncharacterized protein N7481_000012 [Penicillium waksmanii]KAJ5999603.1 hypothetical protein N7481_000012 [Penicillium waksmanii]
MKSTISSDAWERKKELIAKLYVKEEWPLKQVIKQICSDGFNPSETQLRSRLKKWRITKSSHQSGKKVRGRNSGGNESQKDVKRDPAAPPSNNRLSPAAKEISTTGWDWSNIPVGTLLDMQSQQIDQKWNASLAQQLIPSPSVDHTRASDRSYAVHDFPDLNSPITLFEQPARTSTAAEGLIMNTTSAAVASSAGQPVYPGSYILSPESTMAVWSPCPVSPNLGLNSTMHPGFWCRNPLEATTPPPGVPQSASVGPSVSHHREKVPIAVPPSPGAYAHELPHYRVCDNSYWKRDLSLHCDYHGRLKHGEENPFPPRQPPVSIAPLPSSQVNRQSNWPSYYPVPGTGPYGSTS